MPALRRPLDITGRSKRRNPLEIGTHVRSGEPDQIMRESVALARAVDQLLRRN
jgi:hypothetical protein